MRRTAVASLAALLVGCGGGQGLDSPAEASSCGSCHEEQYQAWLGSKHAESGECDVFEAMVDAVSPAVARRCRGCHQPDHSLDRSVTCVSCHSSVGNRGTRDGLLVIDFGAPLTGPSLDPGPTAAHGTRKSDWLRSPRLCGTCHEVTGPAPFIEPTYTEYLASPAFEQGLVCVDCHDPHDHTITPEKIASAFDLETTRVDAATVRVRATNANAGHAVPTGSGFLRDIWIEVAGERVMTIEHLAPGASVTVDVLATAAVEPRVRSVRFRSSVLADPASVLR